MTLIVFLTELAGATVLLLYAVRMVRTGIERAFGSSFRRVVMSTTNPLRAALTGVVMGVVMQSSAAVGLLVAGFSGAGGLSFGTGLSIMLGGDLGSALLIQVLSIRLDWLVPLLIAVGGGFFIRFERRPLRQAGRILLGIAFILIALRFLRETMDPIRDSAFLPSIAGYLAKDFITAFIVGIGLAFVMHSSVAVILMCVTLVAIQTIPVSAGVSLILGANFGSALIPIWLSRTLNATGRRVPLANLLLRGSGAVVALLLVNNFAVLPYLGGLDTAQTLINVHILFNTVMLLWLPFCKRLEAPLKTLLPTVAGDDSDLPFTRRSVLDESALDKPKLALASLKREVLRMSEVVEATMAPVMEIYLDFDPKRAVALRRHDKYVNFALDNIRRYVAAMSARKMTKQELKKARELTEYAIALESAGDIVVKRLLALAEEKADLSIRFSKAGREELISMHERVMANMDLASNVLISDDLESARLLLEEKAEMNRSERSNRRKHLKRLSAGEEISFQSSDIHLETLRCFKDFNSEIATVAYPVLFSSGQLLETQLIHELDQDILEDE